MATHNPERVRDAVEVAVDADAPAGVKLPSTFSTAPKRAPSITPEAPSSHSARAARTGLAPEIARPDLA